MTNSSCENLEMSLLNYDGPSALTERVTYVWYSFVPSPEYGLVGEHLVRIVGEWNNDV